MIDALVRSSSLTQWPDCERRWMGRSMPQMVEAAGFALRRVYSSIGAKVGNATHAGAAVLLQHKIDTGEVAKTADAIQGAIESLRAGVAEGALWDDSTPTMNDAEKQTGRMVAAYSVFIAPKIQPVAVELELTARYSPTLRITGHMDVCENEEIRDTKTGISRRPNHPQYGAYALLRRSHGQKANGFYEDYIPRTPVRRVQAEPESHIYPVEACEAAAHRILGRIDAAIQAFSVSGDPGVFMPNPASQLCSKKFCPAHSSGGFCTLHS